MEQPIPSQVINGIADGLPFIDRFLLELNTPGWLWFFRVLLVLGFSAAIIANRFWRRADK